MTRYPTAARSARFAAFPVDAFRAFVRQSAYPCPGAKAALARADSVLHVASDLRDGDGDRALVERMQAWAEDLAPNGLASFVALFPATPPLPEAEFERRLWARLEALHAIDAESCAWDPTVSSDPASPDFGFSIGGLGLYVVGMHPNASRLARRAPVAALAFNPHAQFRRLRAEGGYDRFRQVVRERDAAWQGDVNPMLADHGVRSEAAQYAGRVVGEAWRCPFAPRTAANDD